MSDKRNRVWKSSVGNRQYVEAPVAIASAISYLSEARINSCVTIRNVKTNVFVTVKVRPKTKEIYKRFVVDIYTSEAYHLVLPPDHWLFELVEEST